ncbi:MAG: hypothetical protein GWN31_08800, partial [Candidatus Thorarchaeota archaeon]|nr:hypothetical protein [Candidatus Thorarchaeota archaeon]NIW14015.1 hypothetical protein [Candidatus Thorarchaeota archaeon]
FTKIKEVDSFFVLHENVKALYDAMEYDWFEEYYGKDDCSEQTITEEEK